MKVELRRDFLEANHRELAGLINTLDTIRLQKGLDCEFLREKAVALEDLGFSPQEVSTLQAEILGLIEEKQSHGKSLTLIEKEKVFFKIEELRLRIAATALTVSANDGTPNTPQQSTLIKTFDKLFQERPALEYFSGNVMGAKIVRHFVILLSSIQNDSDQTKTSRGLLEAFESTPHGYHWMIDFSAVTTLSPLLLGIIYGYRESLRLQGGSLSVCWLHDRLIPETYRQGICQKLSLIRIGDYWFSRHHEH